MEKQMQIPKEYQQLCRDIAKVLRNFNTENSWVNKDNIEEERTIYRFNGRLSISDLDMSDLQFSWENGRHGDGQNKLSISTELRVNTKIDE